LNSRAIFLESIEVNSGSFKAATEKPPLCVKVLDAGADIPVIGRGCCGSSRSAPGPAAERRVLRNPNADERELQKFDGMSTKKHRHWHSADEWSSGGSALKTGCGFNHLKSGYIMNKALKKELATAPWLKICYGMRSNLRSRCSGPTPAMES
jgi:hypothetical protein